MSLDLELDSAQAAIGAALEQFCADRCTPEVVKQSAGRFPDALWRELAALGVLALATPEGDGGALELVAALESLGRAVFPGPLASTALACQLLPEADRKSVVAGEVVVAVGSPPLLPWAPAADIFVELDETRAWKCRARGSVTAVDTLGGEPWGRVEGEIPARKFSRSSVERTQGAQDPQAWGGGLR